MGGEIAYDLFDHTNLWNKGLISADRRTKPTLMLTIPRSSYKSFTKDLTWQTYGIIIQCAFPFKRRRHYFMTLTEAIAVQVILVKVCIVTISMDSDLEAFSHNPTDDSFAALTVQSTALPNIWTNGSSRTKLDYCCNNISSVG